MKKNSPRQFEQLRGYSLFHLDAFQTLECLRKTQICELHVNLIRPSNRLTILTTRTSLQNSLKYHRTWANGAITQREQSGGALTEHSISAAAPAVTPFLDCHHCSLFYMALERNYHSEERATHPGLCVWPLSCDDHSGHEANDGTLGKKLERANSSRNIRGQNTLVLSEQLSRLLGNTTVFALEQAYW